MRTRRPSRPVLSWLAMAAIATGCDPARREAVDLAPPDLASSEAALVASLDAWKADRRASGVLIGSKPSIGVVDSTRTARPLLGYEILGPLMVVEKSRPFAVRLSLDAPRETVATRYLVVGRDPLWVFRQEDFERMLHWEHEMAPAPGPKPPDPAAVP